MAVMSKILLAAALIVSAAFAQTRPASRAVPLDKAKMEAYVRHLLLWGPHITVAVANPVPGPMPGYHEVKVTGGYKAVSLDEIFYVSDDGKKIVRGTVYDIDKNPFASEIALATAHIATEIRLLVYGRQTRGGVREVIEDAVTGPGPAPEIIHELDALLPPEPTVEERAFAALAQEPLG